VDLLLKRTDKALADREMKLEVTDAAKRVLAEQGFDPLYGARPLRRTIQRLVENPISSGILRREFQEGDTIIIVDVDPRRRQRALLRYRNDRGCQTAEVYISGVARASIWKRNRGATRVIASRPLRSRRARIIGAARSEGVRAIQQAAQPLLRTHLCCGQSLSSFKPTKRQYLP
jgi:hypothetical protein